MDNKLKKIKDYYYSKYYSDETADRIKNGVLDEISRKKVKLGTGKKIMYITSAAVLLIGILIGSAFVSPTVANVLAKVPILNALFEEDSGSYHSLSREITNNLEKLDYNIGGSYLRIREKTIGVRINGTDSYFNDVKENVTREIKKLLHAKGLDAYHVEVSQEKEHMQEGISEERKNKIEAYNRKSKKVETAVMNALNQHGYDIFSAHVRINKLEKFIPLEIPVSETRVEEMKQIVNNIVKEMDMGDFTIKVYKTDPEKEKAGRRWQPVITTIAEGLIGIKELKVEGVGYSFYPSPLTISISTSIDSSNSDAGELGKKIESMVHEFVKSEEVVENVKDDPYIIDVYSKDKKKIN